MRKVTPIRVASPALLVLAVICHLGCNGGPSPVTEEDGGTLERVHGPVASGVSAALGEPVPFATPAQLEMFAEGREIALRRFALADGLGPAFNVTFCAGCHERPVTGGSAGLYRNFFIAGRSPSGDDFFPIPTLNSLGGVVRMYTYADGFPARPVLSSVIDVVGQRNPIPFFGVGLLIEVPDNEILAWVDEDDADGDGISGKANYEEGLLGRFGRKAQAASIEGFVRGPLFNHMGVTTLPLTPEQRLALPFQAPGGPSAGLLERLFSVQRARAQVGSGDSGTEDFDAVPDPEMSGDEVFALIASTTLLAAPQLEDPSETTEAGARLFDELGCQSCHRPRLQGPRGPLPVYSDLLVHDMGPDLADRIIQGFATGSEFRTQPLWGLMAVGPYLHDGRAQTIEDAIRYHGGEAQAARDAFVALDEASRQGLLKFLRSLGGRDQYTPGLLPPDAPVAAVGAYGGPLRALSAEEATEFEQGRALFDRDFGYADGAGLPRFNGDSCRACHFEPVIGGAGPRGVNVMRHGLLDDGSFVPPAVGTILHKQTTTAGVTILPQEGTAIYEHRQTPPLFGLGLIDAIAEATIAANADPNDTVTPDGISGRVSIADGGRTGRFGWKAQVPSLAEFVRDAFGAELGMTLGPEAGLTFGMTEDDDAKTDPELELSDTGLMTAYLSLLAPPPGTTPQNPTLAAEGDALFGSVGCANCHVPELAGPDGPVRLYSDLLLHDMLPAESDGIEDGTATMHEFRTAPLWGIADSAPYLHSGDADTLDDAVRAHDGEADAARDAYIALEQAQRDALIYFLESL